MIQENQSIRVDTRNHNAESRGNLQVFPHCCACRETAHTTKLNSHRGTNVSTMEQSWLHALLSSNQFLWHERTTKHRLKVQDTIERQSNWKAKARWLGRLLHTGNIRTYRWWYANKGTERGRQQPHVVVVCFDYYLNHNHMSTVNSVTLNVAAIRSPNHSPCLCLSYE